MVATATDARRSSRRPSSKRPGYFTRAQVEAALHLTPAERDTYERACYFGSSERRERGDTRAVLYSAADLAMGQVAMSAFRAGLRGDQLRQLSATLRTKRTRFTPGWSGRVLVSGDGDIEIAEHGEPLDELARKMGHPEVLLVLAMSVAAEIEGAA
jgi:hypothetical protein